MKLIEFDLSGKFGFFSNNENNQELLVSYPHIHKITILGLLGGILGMSGHKKAAITGKNHPEFYTKLNKIKVSITPLNKNKDMGEFDGVFERINLTLNNSSGWANKGRIDGKSPGANMILPYSILVNPSWHIVLDLSDLDIELVNDLTDRLVNSKYEFMPYLGRAEYFAFITNVKISEGTPVSNTSGIKICGLCLGKNAKTISQKNPMLNRKNKINRTFYKQYLLPVKYTDDKCYYEKEFMFITNKMVDIDSTNIIYVNGKNYCLI